VLPNHRNMYLTRRRQIIIDIDTFSWKIELSSFASVIDTGDYFLLNICMILMVFILIDGMIDYFHGY